MVWAVPVICSWAICWKLNMNDSYRIQSIFFLNGKSCRQGGSVSLCWQIRKSLIRYLSRWKNQNFFSQLFWKMCVFKRIFQVWNGEKWSEIDWFSTESIETVEKRAKIEACWIQFGELEKSRKKSEKKCWQIELVLVLCKGTRESGPEKPLDDRARKALCKLNNDHENKEPWQ